MTGPSRDDLKKAHMRNIQHFHGDGFFGYVSQCVEFPRLSRLDKYIKETKSVESTFMVDGEAITDLDAAVLAMAQPPVLSDEERATLDRVPTEFIDLRQLEETLCDGEPRDGARAGPKRAAALGLLHALSAKGLVEYGREPWAADFNPNMTIDHRLRWSPTIRRTKEAS